MNHSESINELATALCKAQASFKTINKTSENPFFHSKYANLASIIGESKDILSKNGLTVSQLPCGGGDGTVGLTTILMHTSGQYISSNLVLRPKDDTPQGICGCITYARRYSMSAILGLAEDDDDGNAVSQSKQIDYTAKPKASPAGKAAAANSANSLNSTYSVPFGKWKGMSIEQLAEIDPEELESYMHWMAKPKDGKPVSPNAQAFIDVIYDLLNRPQSVIEPRKMVSLPGFDDAPAPTDMDIPF